MYNSAPQSGLASLIQAQGRGDDSMLVHMTPGEVQALQGIANAAGGSLTLNPNTGLPEAGFLKELLPTIAGGFLKSVFPGMGELGISLLTAGVSGLIEGDLKKGLMAGMGAYSGAKLASGISQLGREDIARRKWEQEGIKMDRQKLATELGLTQMQQPQGGPRSNLIRGAMNLPVQPTVQMPDLEKLQEAYIKRELESAATQRPTSDIFRAGIGSLFKPKGFERFQTAVGGPEQAGFVVSPILGALQRAEQEKAQRKFARSQEPNYYYVPGQFDFASGTFAPGGYYTAPGQPYTPRGGFAKGGVVFQEGGETGTEELKQYYQGLLTPPDTSVGEARRAETLAYINALNQQLSKPMPGDTGLAPPGSGGNIIVGTPGGGSSIGYGGYPIGPGLPGGLPPTDMGGPTIGFDPSAGVGLPGQTLDEFLRDARTSVEEPVEEPELRRDEIAQPVDEPSALDEALSTAARGVTAITDPYLDLIERLPGPDWLKTAVVPGFGAAKAIDEAAKKFIVNPVTLEGEAIPSDEETYGEVVEAPEPEPEPDRTPAEETEKEWEESAEYLLSDQQFEDLLPRIGERIDRPMPAEKGQIDPIAQEILYQLATRSPTITIEELMTTPEIRADMAEKQGQLYGPDFQGTSTDFDPTAEGTYDPGSALTPISDTPFAEPYNPFDRNPLEGSSIGLQGPSGAMGPGYNFGFAAGGIIPRKQYAAGGKLLNGPGDGMSDDIKANIDGEQEARLADGEFVIPADVVSHLGNGSTKAGAQKLYAMMDRVRKARTGSTKQGREINPNKFLPA